MHNGRFQESLLDVAYGAAIKSVASEKIPKAYELALPPLEVQKEIVAEIPGFRKIIDV